MRFENIKAEYYCSAFVLNFDCRFPLICGVDSLFILLPRGSSAVTLP